MTCDEARAALSPLLDGALSLSERAPVEAHLSSCGECRRRRSELTDLRSLLRSLEDVEPAVSPRLAKEIAKAVRGAPDRQSGRRAAALTAIATLVGVVLLLLCWACIRLMRGGEAVRPAAPIVVGQTPIDRTAVAPVAPPPDPVVVVDTWEIEVWCDDPAACGLARLAFEDLAEDLAVETLPEADGLHGVRLSFRAGARWASGEVQKRLDRFREDNASVRRVRSATRR